MTIDTQRVGDESTTGDTEMNTEQTQGRDCTHGQLARSCNICYLEQEVANAMEPESVSDGHVYVHVSGLTGSGKSAVAGEIEIAMRAIGLDVEWVDSKSEKRLTHADYTSALELYRPKVRIFEKNIPRTAPPAKAATDLRNKKKGGAK